MSRFGASRWRWRRSWTRRSSSPPPFWRCASRRSTSICLTRCRPAPGRVGARHAPVRDPPGGGGGVKILVVDDDLELLRLIAFALRQSGYLVVEAQDGPSGVEAFGSERPDLAILDVNLPRFSGLEILKKIRATGSATPVMLLTVRSAEEDQVQGLDLGADDYLTKPFSPRTLLARVRALLRRAGLERPGTLDSGDLSLDVEKQAVRVRGGGAVRLTNLETRLLQLLLANGGGPPPPQRPASPRSGG